MNTDYTSILRKDKLSMTTRTYINMIRINPDVDFWVSDTPVTQAFYQKVMGTNPSMYPGEEERPVESVSWYGAIAFCNKLNEARGLKAYYDDKGNILDVFNNTSFRLLTQEEWSVAAYDKNNLYAGTNTVNNLNKFALYRRQNVMSTQKVKSYKPNSYGLYDMCGNVWEWVHTKYGIRGDKRILMGGGFDTSNVYMRKGRYGRDDATLCSHNVGFRICQGSLLK